MAPKTSKKVAYKPAKFQIDCSVPVADSIMDLASFEKFLHERVKVGGRTGALGDKVKISRDNTIIMVGVKGIPFSKRYLKYLTKKFLKSQGLRDHIRVVAMAKNNYSLKYFRNQAADEEEEEE